MSEGVIAIYATFISQFLRILTRTLRWRGLSKRKTDGRSIVWTSIRLTSQCGELCNRICIVRRLRDIDQLMRVLLDCCIK